MPLKIRLIREGKVPQDRRVALTPTQCQTIKAQFPSVDVKVQKSDFRCFKDDEYASAGFVPTDNLLDRHILLGIKEVPINALIPDKTYLFFSHTIKKQPYNRDLLIAILNKNIRLIDYETLTNIQGTRIIAFGRFAGLVGAYNSLRAYGLRNKLFTLIPAYQCFNLEGIKNQLNHIVIPAVKIVITGGGRVAKGAMEILDCAGLKKVTPEALLTTGFDIPVYAQLNAREYNRHKAGKAFNVKEFYENPINYESNFLRFAQTADILIACAYWSPGAPVLFTKRIMQEPNFNIKIIADITCDIEGSIPSTKRASTSDEPFYDYDPATDTLLPAFSHEKYITVMAVDTLPNELPRDASQAFGEQLIANVLPHLVTNQAESAIIRNATITQGGKLTEPYKYLQDFVDGQL